MIRYSSKECGFMHQYYQVNKNMANDSLVSLRDFILFHQTLIKDNLGDSFIEEILNYRLNTHNSSDVYHQFINSQYYSDSFKMLIEKRLNVLAHRIKKILSKQDFKSLTSQELKDIYIALHQINSKGFLDNLPDLFVSYLFHLDSNGSVVFLNQNIPLLLIIKKIFHLYGLSNSRNKKDIYKNDISLETLLGIYQNIGKFSPELAEEMRAIVLKLPVLNSTIFINEMYQLFFPDYNFSLSDKISEKQRNYLAFTSRNYRITNPDYIKIKF